jgi:hypothetical protein
LSALHQLRHLHIHHVPGVNRFDFTAHRELRHLEIGPAKGVQAVALDGLRKLEFLALALMPRLTWVSGSEFFETVTASIFGDRINCRQTFWRTLPVATGADQYDVQDYRKRLSSMQIQNSAFPSMNSPTDLANALDADVVGASPVMCVVTPLQEHSMRPLRYSIKVTLDHDLAPNSLHTAD